MAGHKHRSAPEDQRGNHGRALVSINERLRFSQGKRITCGNIKPIPAGIVKYVFGRSGQPRFLTGPPGTDDFWVRRTKIACCSFAGSASICCMISAALMAAS